MIKSIRTPIWFLGLFTGLVAISTGCGGDYGNSGMGATQGGVQDMQFARALIEEGTVPPPEAFVVEGMFSEHDLPLAGAPCERTLCLRAAGGVAPTLAGESSGFVQIGMSSNVNPETFERPSLSLVATVDVSGSMGGWEDCEDCERASPAQISKELLRDIIAKLDADDEIAIVTYGSQTRLHLNFTRGDEQQAILAAVDALGTDGSTNMEAGLELAFSLAAPKVQEREQTRVMVFTDVQPNVGATEATEFETMSAEAAEDGVGLTVFAAGLGIGQEILVGMSHIKYGNAFGLPKLENVESTMEDHWPWMVSPIATDLTMAFTPSQNVSLKSTYGIPASEAEDVELTVSTVFLSNKKGAMLVEVERLTDEAFSLDGTLSYNTLEGEELTESINAGYEAQTLDENGAYYAQTSVHKTVALAILVTGMKDAATVYADDSQAAIAQIEDVVIRINQDATQLEDENMNVEVELAQALRDLMVDGAEQGDFYGSY
jgi:Ca-activated chloride channel homolog